VGELAGGDKVSILGQPAGGADDAATDASMARIAAAVTAELSVPVSLLDGYLQALVAVSGSGRRLTAGELEVCGQHGQEAVRLGVPLPVLVDTYLTVTWQAWDELPAARAAGDLKRLRLVTRAVLRAADDAAAALADGYDRARQITIRREEATRREFIDDLFDGRGDLELLVERAERFGLGLGGRHLVAVARAREPLTDGTPLTQAAEAKLTRRFDSRNVLVATKAGLLVCVVPATGGDVVGELAGLLRRLGGLQAGGLRVGVGRPRAGPTGVARSYTEAVQALELAGRLGLEDPVVEASGLLVYQVLLRERGAIAELVETVLGPLTQARGGAEPLLDTLAAYFQTGGVAAETARRLHLGTRTVTYRLERIRSLTGYAATDPDHRFTLEAAVLSARLLDWPATPIEPIE
jgi:diguanylate cyclase with GGDEF domain/PucR-like helix-turn-helix protein